jgi:thiol-disulfide isomerase/thioredoxin
MKDRYSLFHRFLKVTTAKFFVLTLPIFFYLQTQQVAAQSPAPDFDTYDYKGGHHDLSTYLSQGKWVFIKFGWPGCASCHLMYPSWNVLYNNYNRNQGNFIMLEFDINTIGYVSGHLVYVTDSLLNTFPTLGAYQLWDGTPAQDTISPLPPYVSTTGQSLLIDSLYQIADPISGYPHLHLINPNTGNIEAIDQYTWLSLVNDPATVTSYLEGVYDIHGHVPADSLMGYLINGGDFHEFYDGSGSVFGVEDNHTPADLVVWPNPTNEGAVNITYTSVAADYLTIQVYDLQGKVVYTQRFHDTGYGKQQIRLNLSGVDNGMYIVKGISSVGASIWQKQLMVNTNF